MAKRKRLDSNLKYELVSRNGKEETERLHQTKTIGTIDNSHVSASFSSLNNGQEYGIYQLRCEV